MGWCREHLQGFLPLTEHPGIREWWALRGRQPEGWAMHMNALGAQRAPVPAASPFTTCVAALPLPTRGLTNTWAPPQLSTESKIYWLFTADFTFNFLLSHSHKVIALACTCIFLFAEGVGTDPFLPRLMNRLHLQDSGIVPPP